VTAAIMQLVDAYAESAEDELAAEEASLCSATKAQATERRRRRREAVEAALAAPPAAGRPPIERYARCSVKGNGWIVEPGIEWREGDCFDPLVFELELIANAVVGVAPLAGPMDAARIAEPMFAARWPGRAYFVEVHDEKFERWTQIFQPYGVPRGAP
jgi:hypothetical protein